MPMRLTLILACNSSMLLNSASENASMIQVSLGIDAQIKCVANAQVKGCRYKKGFIGLERTRCIPV
jgi:hypothetical protein